MSRPLRSRCKRTPEVSRLIASSRPKTSRWAPAPRPGRAAGRCNRFRAEWRARSLAFVRLLIETIRCAGGQCRVVRLVCTLLMQVGGARGRGALGGAGAPRPAAGPPARGALASLSSGRLAGVDTSRTLSSRAYVYDYDSVIRNII
ncbi:hypothetical protein EVAR_28135_1 [Eumeta japonica]|uniref:Uncharacterized protein n=1 Tax=Eumeta variegata TaxID=151549 RepID=A0A4C1VFP2_EUMVA|nr:hypothetical protein EVAR_28135_1 [Eumeta japonica]